MLIATQLGGFGGAGRAGLVKNGLVYLFDVSVRNSYDGSSQYWRNCPEGASALPYLQRGSGSGADAADPTYNVGPPEHFSFDGADYFINGIGTGSGQLSRLIGRQDQPFTLDAWVKRAAGGGDSAYQAIWVNSLVSNAGGFVWMMAGPTLCIPRATFCGTDISGDANTSLSAGWHHLAFAGQGDGSTCTFYLDGAPDGTMTANNAGFTSGDSNNMQQVGYGGGSTYMDNGSGISILRAYNRVLTAAEVRQNFNAQRTLFGI